MSKLTQQEFEKNIEGYMKLDFAIRSVANQYAKKFKGGYVESIEVEFDGVFGTVEVSGRLASHCSCCPDDYMEFTFPLRYIYEEGWIEEEEERREKIYRQREEEKKRKEAEEQKRRQEAEYNRYLKLKEKYE